MIIRKIERILRADLRTFVVFSLVSLMIYVYIHLQLREVNFKWQSSDNHISFHDLKLEESKIPLLTLFTTWKTNSEKANAYENTITNWAMLKPLVNLILFTDEENYKSKVQDRGWDTLPIPKRTHNVPILKHMFLEAMKKYKTQFYGYANGDILFTKSLVDSIITIMHSFNTSQYPTLITGRRVNVKGVTKAEASDWLKLTRISKSRGKLFRSDAEDYFITSVGYPWEDLPNVIVGKRAYDNWLVLNNRKFRFQTVDTTATVLALHQTTKSGDYENSKTPHSNYNARLLSKLFKNINYFGGLVGCAETYTLMKQNRAVVKERKAPRGC